MSFVFVPAGSISSSSTLQILQDASHLWELLCPLVWLLGHFPSLQHVQGSAPTLPCAGVFEGGCQPWHMPVWASHVDISLFVANLLNLWIHVILIGTKVVCHFTVLAHSHMSHHDHFSFQSVSSQVIHIFHESFQSISTGVMPWTPRCSPGGGLPCRWHDLPWVWLGGWGQVSFLVSYSYRAYTVVLIVILVI